MNDTTDPLTRLQALRPTPTLDEDWSVTHLTRITAAATTSATERRTPKRHRRKLISGVLAAALFAGGIGTAAAAGLLPDRLIDLLGSMSTNPGVAAATVQRAGTAAGPDERVFTVVTWEEDPASGYTWCTAPVFETAESAAGPAPTDFDENGGVCGPGGFPNTFAAESGITEADPYIVYAVRAGTATHGELQLPDGSTYPTVLARGWLHGWFPAGSDGVLTGYAADGSVVGTVAVSGRVPR